MCSVCARARGKTERRNPNGNRHSIRWTRASACAPTWDRRMPQRSCCSTRELPRLRRRPTAKADGKGRTRSAQPLGRRHGGRGHVRLEQISNGKRRSSECGRSGSAALPQYPPVGTRVLMHRPVTKPKSVVRAGHVCVNVKAFERGVLNLQVGCHWPSRRA